MSNTVGSAAGFADRVYDDGFVFQDINTTNPGAPLPGTTGFWGYNDNAQVQSGSLVFTGTGTSTVFSQSSALMSNPSWKESGEGASTPSLDLAGMIDVNKNLRVGANFNFMAPRIKSRNSYNTFRVTQTSSSYTDTITDFYDLQGVIPPLAPYSGVFNPVGPTALIDNVPTNRIVTSTLIGNQAGIYSNTIEESLELNFYVLSAGPTMEFEKGHWSGTTSAGIAVNIIDWKAKFAEQLNAETGAGSTSVGYWESERSGIDVLGGLYFQLQLGYAITPTCSLNVFGRHDWMNSMSGNIGPSSYKAILSGYTLGWSIQYRF